MRSFRTVDNASAPHGVTFGSFIRRLPTCGPKASQPRPRITK